jgi:hypothetical protein
VRVGKPVNPPIPQCSRQRTMQLPHFFQGLWDLASGGEGETSFQVRSTCNAKQMYLPQLAAVRRGMVGVQGSVLIEMIKGVDEG